MFVGDSLGRKQQESLICMTSSAVPQSTTKISINDPISTLKFLVFVITVESGMKEMGVNCGVLMMTSEVG
ncbi:unnamed protein product [Lactuca saligna]|uniref:Trichome birefringence-like C-terminal domain-containing protein n=1 Tax=Lactuca saligna TaxID=75948 RepID=A0AA36EDR9_LACSI|nr:unnamed protein product [Lactuca saligna]